mgnify:FL=1
MSGIDIKSFNNADEVTDKFNNAKIEAVKVGDQRVVKLHLSPGWRWSVDVKPHVGTDNCKANHLGVITKGEICAVHEDGTETNYKAGDAYSIKPGHDAWVVGDENVEAYEFAVIWGE